MLEQLCEKVVAYCAAKGYPLDSEPGSMNLIYLEGVNTDGQVNEDRPDIFNDLRMVISPSEDGSGAYRVLLAAAATTEPGQYYTDRPLSREGAARIAFGKHRAWRMGMHKAAHPALFQVLPVPVYRDLNRDGARTGDKMVTGLFGVNHHTTDMNFKGTHIGRYSAGCCVGRDYFEHLYFLYLMSKDPRYVADRNFIFSATIIPGNEL